MQVTLEKLSPVLVEFQVQVPVDRVKTSMNRAYENLARSAHIKGFRKGKAPRNVLQHLFGDRVAYDVANQLVEDTLNSAIQQKNVRPVSQPVVDKPKQPSAEEDFTYRARFEVAPEIEKVLYEGLEAKRSVYEIGESMIDDELKKLQSSHASLVTPEPTRPAKKGDMVTFDFSMSADGKPVAGSEGKGVSAEVGATNLIPELSNAFEGKSIDESFVVELTFPENYQREDLRGQAGRFDLKLTDIKERVLPNLDDEFAKDMGEFETLAALREDIKSKLEKAYKERSETELAEELVRELCAKNPVPVPPSLVDQQAKLQESEILHQAQRQGNPVRSLSADLRQRVRADAEMKVRAGLLMAEIAKSKAIRVGDEDINKAYEELAEQTGQNVNKIKVQYREPRQREMLIGMILEDKVLTIIEEAAKIQEEKAVS